MTSAAFRRSDMSLANWREHPHSPWAFQNVSEFVPSAVIRGNGLAETPLVPLGRFAGIRVMDGAGTEVALPEFLAASHTDTLVVMRGGEVVAEWHAPHVDPARPHIIFSISKSVTGLVGGILEGQGLLSFDRRVVDYIPDAAGSAYGDLGVRDLFNMTVSAEFDEIYLDRTGAFDRYRRAMLWNPERADDPTPTLREFLCSLPKAAHAHGTRHAYRSPHADMAGLVVEAASGRRFADLFGELLWRPLGAHSDAFITVDRAGNPRTSGGISTTARDLARLGDLVRRGGDGIAPAGFVARLWEGGDRRLWAEGDQHHLFPGGSYRAYWYAPGEGELAGMGVFGQSLWIDRKTETVVVRQASEPLPIDDAMDQCVIAMLRAVSAA